MQEETLRERTCGARPTRPREAAVACALHEGVTPAFRQLFNAAALAMGERRAGMAQTNGRREMLRSALCIPRRP